MNSLAVLDPVTVLKVSGGETPALSKALAEQKGIVNSFLARPPDEGVVVQPKPGLQLRIAKQPAHAGGAEIESLRQKTRQWFVDYGDDVEELTQIANAVEGVPQT